MKTKIKSNLMNFLMTLLFITLMSVLGLPMTVYAAGEHVAHTGHAGASSHSGWKPISSAADLIELGKNGGSGYLTCDIETSAGFRIDDNTKLCLNGYSIIATNSSAALYVFKQLSLYDENDNSGKITHAEGYTGRGIICKNTTFNMYGGTVSGNHSGGVAVSGEESLFNFYGGNIAYNSSDKEGGGVYSSDGTVRLVGGSIYENNATGYGGGVFIEYSNMDVISGEILNNTSGLSGGGIYCR
ncbi:MAG: hypothetical protein K5776_01125, partial [Lachnospiraceae bacterium]|nr:hypothetical protein [Lachnospiraceae bacterium]